MTRTMADVGLYLLRAHVTQHLIGSPALDLTLTVNAVNGTVRGQAIQSNPSILDYPPIHIEVDGTFFQVDHVDHTKRGVLVLKGSATRCVRPPAEGCWQEPFSAGFVLDFEGNGVGGWKLGDKMYDNAGIEVVQ